MNNFFRLSLSIVSIFYGLLFAQTNGFFSNEIIGIASSGDTVSLLSGKYDKITQDVTYAVSYVSKSDSSYLANDLNWKSFTFAKNTTPIDIAFGAGITNVVFDTLQKQRINVITVINHKVNAASQLTIPWSNTLLTDSSKHIYSKGVVFLNNAFYFSCRAGAIVKWDISTDKKSVLVPGLSSLVSIDTFKGIADSTKWVNNLEVSNNRFTVTSSSSIWIYSLSDSTWVEYPNKSADPLLSIKRFDYAISDPYSASHPTYCIAKVLKSTIDTTYLLKYSSKENGWLPVLDHAIAGLTFGTKGHYYTYFEHDSTNCKVYRDTLGDTAVQFKPLPIDAYYIPARIKSTDNPQIYDIFFSAKNDSSGTLIVGTSDGLYISRNEIPGVSKNLLQCIKRITPAQNNLKEVFACPGILKNTTDDGTDIVRFVYCLSKNAKVTIRIYDFNNDLVKTVIEKQPRFSGTENSEYGRSNDKKIDIWDGKTASGRQCAPGVYYFKITTDIGEHAFGKIVVAK